MSSENFAKLTENELFSQSFLEAIFDEIDETLLAHNIDALLKRAGELRCTQRLRKVLAAHARERKQLIKEKQISDAKTEVAKITNFPDGFEPLDCGDWIANSDGIRKVYPNGIVYASYYPILPVMYLHNVHTHLEKAVLAYYKEGKWNTITVNKSDIASTQAIVKLAERGLGVDSNKAKALIDYLSYVEARNPDKIPRKKSTNKMGWHDGEREFMPYSDSYVFDGGNDYNNLYSSITDHGSYDAWKKAVKKIRATGRIESLFFLAASFGSPLLELLDVQTFAVNLWGDSGNGKTMCTRLATSVWADDRPGKYWATFQSTQVGYEIMQGFLNNLPMLIDDSADVKDKEHFNFSTFTYNRCNEKGKTRSNTKLGISLENTWRQIVLMTGEQPVVTDQMQGGAINRTLELASDSSLIIQNPREVLKVLDENYGHAGKDFIEIIIGLGRDYLFKLYDEQIAKLAKFDKLGKQTNSLAVILTADILTEKYIFKDGVTIDVNEAAKVLTDKSMISENERCYEHILSQVAIQADRFKPTGYDNNAQKAVYKGEIWGRYNNNEDVLYIVKTVLDKMCAQKGYSSKKFLNWAKDHDKIICAANGDVGKSVRLPNSPKPVRCICLKIDDNVTGDSDDNDTVFNEYNSFDDGVPF